MRPDVYGRGMRCFVKPEDEAALFDFLADKNENTAKVYKTGLMTFFSAVRKVPEKVTVVDVDKFFRLANERMDKGEWTAGYVRMIRSAFKGFYKHYYTCVKVDENSRDRYAALMGGLPGPIDARMPKEYLLSDAMFTMLLSSLYDDNAHEVCLYAVLSFVCGLNSEEIENIRPGSFFRCGDDVGVYAGKGKSRRKIMLPEEALLFINAYLLDSGYYNNDKDMSASIFGYNGRPGHSRSRISFLLKEKVSALYEGGLLYADVTLSSLRTVFMQACVMNSPDELIAYTGVSDKYLAMIKKTRCETDPLSVVRGLCVSLGLYGKEYRLNELVVYEETGAVSYPLSV